jgi:hypothetical protein
MSGREGGRSGGRGGRGRGGRSQNYSGLTNTSKKGLRSSLDNNIFDFGTKASPDQMKTSMEKVAQYAGTTMSQDICNELLNRRTVILAEPVYTDAVKRRHATRETMERKNQENMHNARLAQRETLVKAVNDKKDDEAHMKLALLDVDIAKAVFEAS